MGKLTLTDINKYFKTVHAVKDVSFDVEEGEFISLLGPSGCGKTTTLRMVAGFEEVSSGVIHLADREITYDQPFQRNTGMVFQNYALFPHMTVEQNIAFGLRMRKADPARIPDRVGRALDLIQLPGYEQRMPHELSGGQQQRIALARALAIEPAVLLLDEPLSNLDAKLREDMRIEIKQIQKKVGITSVFVTHDQEEALILSDRILVMHEGRIVESGTPLDIYSHPTSAFAASFIGHSNVMQGTMSELDTEQLVVTTEGGLVVRGPKNPQLSIGDQVLVFVRQERMSIHTGAPDGSSTQNLIPAEVLIHTFVGPTIEYICRAGGHELRIRRPNEGHIPRVSAGQHVHISWEPSDCIVIRQ